MSRCSVLWAEADLPAWGTAPRADFWVCLEAPGPWGPKAATSARALDHELGAQLEDLVAGLGGRLLLLRQARRNTVGDDPLTVLVSGGFGDGGWATRFEVGSPEEVLTWVRDWDSAGRPEPSGPEPDPILLVCSHAHRDRCCAIEGRPLLAALEDDIEPGLLWECSHLGGHRYAPTALLLPTGQVLGRLTRSEAVAAYRDAGVGLLWPGGSRRDRGRSHLEPGRQAAEAWALERFGPVEPTDLSSSVDGDRVHLRHGDHRATVRVTTVTTGGSAPLSCGKDPEPVTFHRVDDTAPGAGPGAAEERVAGISRSGR